METAHSINEAMLKYIKDRHHLAEPTKLEIASRVLCVLVTDYFDLRGSPTTKGTLRYELAEESLLMADILLKKHAEDKAKA